MEKHTGNPALIRDINQRLIVNALRQHPSLSRAGLSKLIGISAPSITRIVEPMLAKGLIQEMGTGTSSIGRKPTMLRLNPRYRTIVGIDYSGKCIQVALGDLFGRIIEAERVDCHEFGINSRLLDQTIGCIERLLERNQIRKDEVKAITIGVPGIVDSCNRRRVYSPDWFVQDEAVDLVAFFGSRYQTEVFLGNDINLSALGECCFGAGQSFKHLVLISVGHAIGGGIIFNRQIYTGYRFAAGEIGYCRPLIDLKDGQVALDQRRLEEVISSTAILKEISTDIARGKAGAFLERSAGMNGQLALDQIVEAVQAKDPYCLNILHKIALYLAWAVINIACVLDIDLIVIGGDIAKFGRNLEERITNQLHNIVPAPFAVQVRCSLLGDKAGILGSFSNSLEYLFSKPL